MLDHTEGLTPTEQAASDAMIGALIDEAKGRGFDLMGIDYPAVAVREAVAAWLVAERRYRPVATASGREASGRA